MSITYSGDELINIAISMERRGVAFYDVMSKSTESAIAQEIFNDLAEMEREHALIFQDMLEKADKHIVNTDAGEYADYLKAMVDSAVFSDELITSEMASQIESDVEALELAIGAEKDSILFYYQLREIMSKPAKEAVDRIITEEKGHLILLTGLKKELAA